MTIGKDDWPENITEEEAQALSDFIMKSEVPYPDAGEVDRTIAAVRLHMSMKMKKRGARDRLKRLLQLTVTEVSVISLFYWIVSAALYVAGFIIIGLHLNVVPELVLFTLSPIPFLLGLAEVFRGRDEGMLELEMSCTFNAPSIMLSKLTIVGLYNIGLNVLCSLVFVHFAEQAYLGTITLLWMVPFTIMSGLGLLVALYSRGSTAMSSMLVIWLSFCMVVLLKPDFIQGILTMNEPVSLLLVVAGLILIVTQLILLFKKTSEVEGGDRLETNA